MNIIFRQILIQSLSFSLAVVSKGQTPHISGIIDNLPFSDVCWTKGESKQTTKFVR